nr:MAG TPA_asm: hypothetical protein [Caudoviricetes sp.]
MQDLFEKYFNHQKIIILNFKISLLLPFLFGEGL